MTMPDDYEIVTDQDYSPDIKMGVPQDFGLDDAEKTYKLAPEFSNLNTVAVPEFPSTIPVLNRRVTRHRCVILVASVTAATAVVFAKDIDSLLNGVANNGLAGAGFYVPSGAVPYSFPWEGQRGCFATAIGGTALVTFVDESYAQDRSRR